MSEERKVTSLPLEGALTIYTAADRKAALLQAIEPASAVEFDLALVDEIETPKHSHRRFTVGY